MKKNMKEPRIHKVTVNIGAGGDIELIKKAEKLLENLTGGKPVRTYAKATVPEFNVKKHAPTGVKVTLRREDANKFLKRALDANENKIKKKNIDREGNLAFGVKEYIEMPDTKYDPDIGMFGMDVCANLERPGYRIARRRYKTRKIPNKIRITPEESEKFFCEKFGVEVE